MAALSYAGRELTFTAVMDPDGKTVCELRTTEPPQYSLSADLKTHLLSLANPQAMSLLFFRELRMAVKGQIRADNKKRFYRVSIDSGSAVFEVPISTIRTAKMACALKAVKAFCPGLVGEWLHRYRKTANIVAEFL